MFQIRVERLVDADIETVFAALTAHADYDRFPGIDRSVLLEPGKQTRNGAGALRQIVSRPFRLDERITVCEPPVRMEYRIEKSRPLPIQHEHGEIVLAAEGGRTRVRWSSQGRIMVPLLGPVLDRIIEQRVARSFAALLNSIGER